MIKPLTSLRFFFALMVFASHLDFVRPGASEILKWWYDHVLYEGYIGVTFFFVPSGFILAYTYQKKLSRKEIRCYDFLVARIARIYPMHVVTLLAAIPIVVAEASSTYPQFFARLIANATLTQSFVPSESFYFSFNGVSWSISDEMFFYILFPLIIPWHKPSPYVYGCLWNRRGRSAIDHVTLAGLGSTLSLLY